MKLSSATKTKVFALTSALAALLASTFARPAAAPRAAKHGAATPSVAVRSLRHPDVRCLAFSPDGKTLASGSNEGFAEPGDLRVWNLKTGKLVKVIEHRYGLDSVAFSPDGKTLAVVSEAVRLWDVRSWKLRRSLAANKKLPYMWSVAFSPGGKTVAGGGNMGETGESDDAYLWDARTGKLKRKLQDSNGPSEVVFSPDGKTLVGAFSSGYYNDASDTVRWWDTRTGKLRYKHPQPWVTCIAMSPNGTELATGSGKGDHGPKSKLPPGEIRLWDVQTGKLRRTFVHDCAVTSICYSPNGKRRASGDERGVVRLCDARTGKLNKALRLSSKWIDSLTYSPDGKTLAGACGDGTIKLWRIR